MPQPSKPQNARQVAAGKSTGPGPRQYAALLTQLRKSQWLDSAELSRYQLRLAKALVAHSIRTVPLYRQRLQQPELLRRDLTLENWRELPILTRTDLQQHEILSQGIPKEHGRLFATQTSGSTGQPVKIYCSGYSQFYFRTLNLRDHLWHKRDMTAKHASIRVLQEVEIPPEGLISPSWGHAVAGLFGSGPSVTLSVRNSIEHQLRWLVEHDPSYILTYPSNLAALLEQIQANHLMLPSLKEVRTIGETVPADLRRQCQEVVHVPLTDVYSSQEVGIFALQCPEHDHYHIQSESVIVEVLDSQGQPCQPGEIGRVVVTALHNYATPLIRYEIRDYAEVGDPCPCGRGLPVLKRIVGRQRNMLMLPSGEKRWPVFDWGRYSEIAPIQQFQFIQHSLEEIEMRLVCDRGLTDDQQQQLIGIIQNAFEHPFQIKLTFLNEIKQGPNGKFEEFISHLT